MDLNALPVFVSVVRSRSFSAGARSLKMPVSTVSTKITLLEKELGAVLLTRTTRQLHLTEAGEIFYEYAERVLAEISEAETLATSTQDKVQGPIRVTCTVELGSTWLSSLLAEFLKLYPDIQIELLLTDRLVDVVRERVDLAIRIGELDDSSLVTRRLGYVERRAYASPQYLRKHGVPKSPEQLDSHSLLEFQVSLDNVLKLRSKNEAKVLKTKARFTVNNLISLKNLVLGGAGIAFLPEAMCRGEVSRNKLVSVLADWKLGKIPVHLIHAKQKFVPRRVRLLHEFLSENLKEVY